MNFTGINPAILELMLGSGSQTTTAPTTDPTYSSGFDYARSIAGGIPASQMIASGVSYSPDQPGGYTQADLNRPVLPEIPVQPLPEPIIEEPIIEEPITGPIEPGFDGGFDFSNIPGYGDQDSGFNFGGFNPRGLPGINFLENLPNIQNLPNQNIDFSQIDYSRIQPNFEMPKITQPIIQPKGGLLGGIGRGISGLQGIQKDFTGFKEDLKNKAANKVLGLFGI
jgi:hypothetical protein